MATSRLGTKFDFIMNIYNFIEVIMETIYWILLSEAMVWTNIGLFLIQTPRTNFSEILSKIHTLVQENALKNVV